MNEQKEMTTAEFQVGVLLDQIAKISRDHAVEVCNLKTQHAIELQEATKTELTPPEEIPEGEIA